MKKSIFLIVFCSLCGLLSGYLFSYFSAFDFVSVNVNDSSSVESLEMVPEKLPLEDILRNSDDLMRKVSLQDYARNLPTEDLPTLIDDLLNSDNRDSVIAFSVLLERDFKLAKQYLGNQNFLRKRVVRRNNVFYFADENVFQNNIPVQDMGKLLFFQWMKSDFEGCIVFLEGFSETKSNTEQAEMWKSFLVSAIREWPEKVLEYETRIWQGKGDSVFGARWSPIYRGFYGNWYQKNPEAALVAALSVKNDTRRESALSEIIEKIMISDPEKGMEFIRDYYEWGNRKNFMHRAFYNLVQDNPEHGLQILKSGTFFDEESDAKAYMMLLSHLTTERIHQLLLDESSGIGKAFILDIVENSLSLLGPPALDEDSAREKMTFLDYLSPEERQSTIEKIVSNRSENRFVRMVLYDEFPKERQDPDLIRDLDQRRPEDAVSYFVDSLYVKGNANDSSFDFAFNHFLNRSKKDAIAYAKTITDKHLKERAELLIHVHDFQDNVTDSLDYLNRFPENALAKSKFQEILGYLAENDYDSFAQALINTPHESWRVDAVKMNIQYIWRDSPDGARDVIDALSDFPDYQEQVRKQSAESFAMFSRYEAALSIALDMKPGEETNRFIEEILDRFRENSPEKAKRWYQRNGLEWKEGRK